MGNGEDILVAPAGHVDDDGLILAHGRCLLEGLDKGVRRFHGRDEAFGAHGQA